MSEEDDDFASYSSLFSLFLAVLFYSLFVLIK